MRIGRCLVLTIASVSLVAACTGHGHGSAAIADNTTPQHPRGSIVGRMYAIGGTPPGTPSGMTGTIAITAAGSKVVVARPVLDSRGYFSVSLAPGRYEIVGTEAKVSPPLRLHTTVVVRAWAKVSANLVLQLT